MSDPNRINYSKKTRVKAFAIQTTMAVCFIFMVLIGFNYVSSSTLLWAIGSGALSSTAFIVFSHPMTKSAEPKQIIMGYVIGLLSGLFVSLVMHLSDRFAGITYDSGFYLYAMEAACSVGITLLIMNFFHVNHPPAAGIALVLVIDINSYNSLAVIALAVLFLSAVHHFLRGRMIDLA